MKFNKFFIPVACLALSLTTVSCDGESDDNIQMWDWSEKEPEPVPDPNQYLLDLGWTNSRDSLTEICGQFPEHINIYRAPETLQGRASYAFIAVANLNDVTFDVLGEAQGLKTPSEYYEESHPSVITNGGYFYQNSLSLIMRNGELICPNNQVDSPDWTETFYYMPRGTFAVNADKTVNVSWVYTLLSGTSYSYPTSMPLENGVVPSADYPAGGVIFESETAIGGGPVLVKDNVIYNTHHDEFLPVDVDGLAPRTAIGYNPTTNNILLFACAGRGINSVKGYTLAELAEIMKGLGCTESVNLDGGGSTVMLVNGVELFKPSDGQQRRVGSCPIFK